MNHDKHKPTSLDKHTPGPWTVDKLGAIRGGPHSATFIAITALTVDEAARKANGELIAHAPEMRDLIEEAFGSIMNASPKDGEDAFDWVAWGNRAALILGCA